MSSPFETYQGLRNLALRITASDIGFTDIAPGDAYGAVMEMALPKGIATLVAFLSGDASLYTSTGWGVIGGGRHESVAVAAKAFVACASIFIPKMTATETFDFPTGGRTGFYVFTSSGKFKFEDLDDDLMKKNSDFTPLYGAGHAVISALRPFADEVQAAKRR